MSQVDSCNDGSDSKGDKSASCAVLEMDRASVGKVDIGLIETILGEMKSEFNREVNTTENVMKDKDSLASKGVTDDESLSVKNETQESETGQQKQSEVKVEDEADSNNQSSAVVSAVGNTDEKQFELVGSAETPSISSKNDGISGETGSDAKPRIVITLKTSEDSSDGSKKIKGKSTQDSESNSEEVWTLVSPELRGETGADTSATPPRTASSGLASGKRSLRSQMAAAAAKATVEEPAGVKRSARRRSKDSPRESVLQSAIARKEKSFSNLGQGEDKISAARNLKVSAHRPPRLSPTEKNQTAGSTRTSKSPARAPLLSPKSPRISQQNLHNDHTPTKSVKSEDIANPAAEVVTKSSSAGNKSSHSSTSKAESGLKTTVKSQSHVQSSNTQAYTKTGKRRYRPYKGLRYSFTGNNVRRTKPPRRQVKEPNSNSNMDATEKKSSEPEETNETIVLPDEQPTAVAPTQQEQLECADPIAKSHAAEFPTVDLCGKFFLQYGHSL
jgi:hypothetical protein